MTAVPLVDKIARGNELMVAAQPVKPGSKEKVCDNDGGHEMKTDQKPQPLSVSRPAETEQGIAAVLGGIQGEQKHREAHGPARKIKISQAVLLPFQVGDSSYDQKTSNINDDLKEINELLKADAREAPYSER